MAGDPSPERSPGTPPEEIETSPFDPGSVHGQLIESVDHIQGNLPLKPGLAGSRDVGEPVLSELIPEPRRHVVLNIAVLIATDFGIRIVTGNILCPSIRALIAFYVSGGVQAATQ